MKSGVHSLKVELKSVIISPIWFWTIRFPYLMKVLFQDPRKPRWKRVEWNSSVYDGMNSNQFIMGNKLMSVCNKLKLSEDCYWDGCQCISCTCKCDCESLNTPCNCRCDHCG